MHDERPATFEEIRWVRPGGGWGGPPVVFIEAERHTNELPREDSNVNALGAAMLAWAVQVAPPDDDFYAAVFGLIGLSLEEALRAQQRLEEMGYTLVRRWRTAADEGEEVLWPKPRRKPARHNKFGRRYRRHQEKHTAYFEAIARDVIATRHRMVDLGPVTLDVRLSRFNRWLEVARPDGSSHMRTNVARCKGDNLVHAIAEYLMVEASNYPGVEVPRKSQAEPD